LNGTAYHNAFKDWNLDFGIDATSAPIELMNLPPKEAAYFYGAGFGPETSTSLDTALNCSSRHPFRPIPAPILRCLWTLSVTPPTLNSSNSKQPKLSLPLHKAWGDFSNVVLNIGLDLNPKAIARIVFNQSTGEEIRGKAEGHLDVRVNDFEEIALNGALQIMEGTTFLPCKT
jgi:hypothetical protein